MRLAAVQPAPTLFQRFDAEAGQSRDLLGELLWLAQARGCMWCPPFSGQDTHTLLVLRQAATRSPPSLDQPQASGLYHPRRRSSDGRRNHRGSGRTESGNPLRLFDSNLVRHKKEPVLASFSASSKLSWHREFESAPLRRAVHLFQCSLPYLS